MIRNHTETSQQRADRLLAQYRRARNARRAETMVLELSGDPLPEPSRWQRIRMAVRPWLAGFDTPLVDAIGLAFLVLFSAIVGAFVALVSLDGAPPASGALSADMEATTRPAVAYPLDGGATRAVR